MKRLFTLLVFIGLFSGCQATGQVMSESTADLASDKKAEAASDYEKIVTDDTVTDDGLFTTHRNEDTIYFEIPDSLLGREMLLVSRIAKIPANISGFMNAGSKTGENVIRWERKGNQILLRSQSYTSVAADSLPVALSVQNNNFQPIIGAFDIEAVTPDSSGVVIDVTDLYSSDIPAMTGMSPSLRTRFRVRRLDTSRSFVDEVKSFPINVNVKHTLTYDATEPPSNSWTGTISMQMFQSMILLPEEPMMPRLEDPRVGYFTVSQIDFGSEQQKAAEYSYIRRWRLEPSDPEAYARGELVEPVKPIVYYLDPATPEKWRPYFLKGIEDWQWVFEAAGFKNAIIAKEAPSPEEDPDWDPEDARYSTMRYVANTTRNATGPSVSDPRSGEIIESDIIWYHNHIRSYRNRLMIETGAANPQARSLMIDDELIGETMRQVIAHEIGHALGLPHNMIASSAFPVDSLRSPTFTSEYGVAPTIMDYTRQNYIAQPGDGVTRFVRKVGPYDRYAIEWGYRWYPDITSPQDEKRMLDALIEAHADNKMYRFASSTHFNPEAQTEDMGDDPVKASGYAVANLKRVVPNLIDWTSTDGVGYADLDEIYGELQGMWSRYMGHVVTVIGGVEVTPKASDQEGPVYRVVEAQRQRDALAFLSDNVFTTPDWMLNPDILRRIEPAGAVDRLRSRQVSILGSVLNPARLQRMVEAEAIDGDGAYPMLVFMGDVTDAVWSEFSQAAPSIDTFRRNLQRGHLDQLENLMTSDTTIGSNLAFFYGTGVNMSQSDIRPAARAQLEDIRTKAERNIRLASDDATRLHLRDVVERIDGMLDAD